MYRGGDGQNAFDLFHLIKGQRPIRTHQDFQSHAVPEWFCHALDAWFAISTLHHIEHCFYG